MKKKTIIIILIIVVSIGVVAGLLLLDHQMHDPHIKSVEESHADLEKARQKRIEAEAEYNNAIKRQENARSRLEELEKKYN